MPNEQLVAYIRGEFAQGVDRATIIRSLITASWKVEDINAAMASIDAVSNQSISSAPHAPMAPVHAAYSVPATSVQSGSIKRVVQDIAAGLFIACVTVLTAISVLGVWDVFSGDVITKSFITLGLLAFVSVIVIAAGKWVGDPSAVVEPSVPNPIFRATRNITLVTLIVSSTLLALLGVLAIWDVINDTSTVNKSLGSLAIIAFSSLVIVMVCREREGTLPKKKVG